MLENYFKIYSSRPAEINGIERSVGQCNLPGMWARRRSQTGCAIVVPQACRRLRFAGDRHDCARLTIKPPALTCKDRGISHGQIPSQSSSFFGNFRDKSIVLNLGSEQSELFGKI